MTAGELAQVATLPDAQDDPLLLRTFAAGVRSRRDLTLENLTLRHQLQVALRRNPHPRLQDRDRVLWVWLDRLWPDSRRHLLFVKPPRSPKANAVAERLVRTPRSELLDHVTILNERHLSAVLSEFAGYNHDRPHRSLALQPPLPRRDPRVGRVTSFLNPTPSSCRKPKRSRTASRKRRLEEAQMTR